MTLTIDEGKIMRRVLIARALGKDPEYCGRRAAAAPAVGSHRRHREEQQQIIDSALKNEDA